MYSTEYSNREYAMHSTQYAMCTARRWPTDAPVADQINRSTDQPPIGGRSSPQQWR